MALNGLGLGFLFSASDQASGVMHRVQHAFEGLSGGANKMSATMKGAFKQFGLGAAIMGTGLLGLAALDPAIEESREFSKAIALVATEADEAIFPQEKMAEVAEKLATAYGKAPTDEAKALYKAVALGANDAAKSQSFLNGVNLLSVAGNADLELSANALGGALNAYGASFSQATEYSDAFFTAMKMGNTTVQDLAASVGRVTSSAANMNVSIQEILGAVSVMTNKGVQASEAVSGLKEALANIVHPAHDAKAEAARLGIKFDQATLRAKGLQGFLQMIAGSAKFNAESFSKLFTSVEGSNAIIQVASGNMGAYNDVMKAMGDSTGATQKGFDIMSETLDFQKQKYDANKKVVLGMIGKALEPMGAAALRVSNAIFEAFTRIPKPVVAFFVRLFAGVSTMLAVVGGALMVKAAFVLVSGALSVFGLTFGKVLAAAFAAIWPVVVAIGLMIAVFYAFRLAYEKNIGGFGDFIRDAVAKAQLAFSALGQLFDSGGFSGKIMEDLNKAENSGVKAFAINVFLWVERIRNFLSGFGDGFTKGIEAAKPAFDALLYALREVGKAMGFLGEKDGPESNMKAWERWGQVGAIAGRVIAVVVEGIVFGLAMVAQNIAWTIQALSFLNSVGRGAVGGVVAAFYAVKGAAIAVRDGVVGAVSTVGGAFSSVGSAIGAAFMAAYSYVAAVVRRIITIISLVADIATIILAGALQKFANFLEPYVAVFLEFQDMVVGIVTDAFHTVVEKVRSAFLSIGYFILGVAASFLAPIIAAVAYFVDYFNTGVEEVEGAAGEAFTGIVDEFMPVVTFLSDMWQATWELAGDIAEGVLGVIRGALEGIANVFGKIFGGIAKVASMIGGGIKSGVTGAVGYGLDSIGVREAVGSKVGELGAAVSGPLQPPPASPGTNGMPATAASGATAAATDMSQTNAHLASIAAGVKQGQGTTIVQIDGEQLAAKISGPGARGFSPSPVPTG